MMNEPVKLVPKASATAEIKTAVVDLLCETLIDAQRGNILEIIIVAKEVDGGWYHRASGTLSVREQIGALEIIKYERIKQTECRYE
jgi:hypothetical protein